MNPEKTEQQSFYISQDKLFAFVRAMMGRSGGREGDEHPLRPGPWDPVIRAALERVNVFGPQPEPWQLCRVAHEDVPTLHNWLSSFNEGRNSNE